MTDRGADDGGAGSLAGELYEIRDGDAVAVVAELGAGLQRLAVAGWEVLDTYPPEGYPGQGARGQVLLPWPNRIAGGRYTFDGADQQLPIDDPDGGNAIHGLTRWMNWRPVWRRRRSLTMRLDLHARPGYPFALVCEEQYTIHATALRVRTRLRNVGPAPAPVGVGHHPYLSVGTERIDAATLQVPARAFFKTDARGIPALPPVPVGEAVYDFRSPRTIGGSVLDVGLTDLDRGADGCARVRLTAPGGTPELTVVLDEAYTCVQVYTGDTLADASRRRTGLAVEPCTCPADAFNNGWGLRVLRPGQEFDCSFAIAWRDGATAGEGPVRPL